MDGPMRGGGVPVRLMLPRKFKSVLCSDRNCANGDVDDEDDVPVDADTSIRPASPSDMS